MKTYHSLKVCSYYVHNPKKIKQIYHQRLQSPLTIKTNLIEFVNGYQFPLFYVITPKIYHLINQIEENSKDLSFYTKYINHKYLNKLILSSLFHEVKATNHIEGVNLSNQHIHAIFHHIFTLQSLNKDTLSYEEFTQMYLMWVVKQCPIKFKHLYEIRKMWNYLFYNSMPKDKVPQHTTFRNSYVRIGNSTKTVWQPKANEHELLPDLKNWLKFINHHHDLISIIIAHYYFEAIHPFFDGNGRTGRFLLSDYLSNNLDVLTALNLSQYIDNHQGKYYHAFQLMDNPKNYGEVTFFIQSILQVIANEQSQLFEYLKQWHHLKGTKQEQKVLSLTKDDTIKDKVKRQNGKHLFNPELTYKDCF